MLSFIHDHLEKTAQFIERHQTVVACAITGAICWKISHEVTLSGVLEETTELAYKWGQTNGVLLVQNNVLREFIDAKGLNEEIQHYITRLATQ